MIEFRGIRFEIDGQTSPTPDAVITSHEESHRFRFHDDYRAFLTRFGGGEFEDIFFRVVSPEHAIDDSMWLRDLFRDQWDWDGSPEILTREQAMTSLSTLDCGEDLIISLPDDPSFFYYLPRGYDTVTRLDSMSALVAYIAAQYRSVPPVYTFRPFG